MQWQDDDMVDRKNKSIIIKNLTYKYKDRVIFDCATTTFNADGITAIVGDNGGGKTTLIHLLAGILPDKNNAIHNTYNNPMCTFQTPILLNRTVYKNIVHTAKALNIENPEIMSEQALQAVELFSLAHLPATALSGGQKMRLQIARMIVSNSKLWLLDEPYAGLDFKSSTALDDSIIRANNQGIKIIIVTHNLDVIKRLADNVVQVKHQKIDAPVTTKEFFNKIQ